MSNPKNPQGFLGIFTTPQGDVVATSAVFDVSRPAGFTKRNAQMVLAKRMLAAEVARAYCAPDYAKAIPEYYQEKIMEGMKGFRVSFVPIGYEEEEND